MLTGKAFSVKMILMKIILIIYGVVLSFVSLSYADVYQYTSEDGIVCYTDLPFGKKADLIMKDRVGSSSSRQKYDKTDYKDTAYYQDIVHEKASKYDVDPSLVKALIKTESNWNERAVSRKGAMGLMQLMPSTASDMNVRNPYDPEENIEGGVKYLRNLLERFNGDLTLALAAYNAGPKWVDKFGMVPPITETKQYVKKVLSLYKGGSPYSLTASGTGKEKKPERIYKVSLEDGSVLFTNSPFLLKDSVGF
jgi:hypothetical protein